MLFLQFVPATMPPARQSVLFYVVDVIDQYFVES